MASRRKFVTGSAAAMAAVSFGRIHKLWGAGMNQKTLHLWLGSCARGGKDGIFHATFDPATGKASEPTLAIATEQPSFLCTLHEAHGKPVLYSVNEAARGDGGVSAFSMNADKLTQLNHVSVQSIAPCYISAHKPSRTLYTANYNGGTVTVLKANADGTVTEVIQKIDLSSPNYGQPGPHTRQGKSHPHTSMLSPDGRFLIVNDLGKDRINVFRIQPDGKLDEKTVKHVECPPATGPRHVAFHPNGKWVYGINELNNTLQRYSWNAATGELKPLDQRISTMQPNGPAPNPKEELTAAEVAISPDGRFLYACTRGDDSLTVFSIAKDGELALKQRIGCGGAMPRHFALDPTAGWIVCCNNSSPDVTIFKRNAAEGTLTGPVQTLHVEATEFALFT